MKDCIHSGTLFEVLAAFDFEYVVHLFELSVVIVGYNLPFTNMDMFFGLPPVRLLIFRTIWYEIIQLGILLIEGIEIDGRAKYLTFIF